MSGDVRHRTLGLIASLILTPAALLAPLPTSAQELTGWTIIHSSAAFDYLVSVESVVREDAPGDSTASPSRTEDRPEIVRMFVARMLSRRLDSVRGDMVADPARGRIPEADSADVVPAVTAERPGARAGAVRPDAYRRYASATHVIEIRCSDGQLRRGKSMDFADDGTVLGEWEDTAGWQGPPAFDEPQAMEALVEWACKAPS